MTNPPCKFKVGDAVIFDPERSFRKTISGIVVDVDHRFRFPVTVQLGHDFGLQSFTSDGRFHSREEPSLRLASELPTWTVILLYPDYMTDDFGADIYVDSAEANDPYEAVKIVQETAASAASAAFAYSADFHETPDNFRCIGVIKGKHNFVLDATSF